MTGPTPSGLSTPPCVHCGAYHATFAARLVEQIGPKVCAELAAARVHMERKRARAGRPGWVVRLRQWIGGAR